MAERYVIRGGRAGFERLQLLARDRWPDTSALLARAGVRSGMRCIDLGCGGGEVSFEIAKLVAPDGHVTGVDMDEVKLELAREEAAARGIDNIEFRPANVNEWNEPDRYDLAYTRFLLQHLSHPVDLLRRMWDAVRVGGVLVAEDADFEGWCCYPPNDGFDFFLRTYGQVLARRGGDHIAGRKLYRYFLEAGIPEPHIDLVQPLRMSGEVKTLSWTTLEASTEAIVSEGVATEAEVHAALASLEAFTDDSTTLIGGPRVFQLWSPR
jgi:ubiquinone/menaquinone biosynthesis C-methylase UbiE